MRKTILFAATVAALLLTAIRTWFGVRIFTATGALAGSAGMPSPWIGFAVLAAMILLFVLEII